MKGAFRIAVIADIPLLVHWSFSLILLWILYIGFSLNTAWEGILWMIALVLALFFCVVLHEYGHALTARRFSVPTKDIILFPVGGVARLTRLPENPWEEFKIAIAGPLVNAVLAILFGLVVYAILGKLPNFWDMEPESNPFLYYFLPGLFWMNVFLVLFNLLPAFPMDGGRMLRSLLSLKLGRKRATNAAAILGQIMAVLLFILGAFTKNFLLCFVSVFVFLAARHENRTVRMDALLGSKQVQDIMRPQFSRFTLGDSMSQVADVFDREDEKNFLLFDAEGAVAGVLQERFIKKAIERGTLSLSTETFLSPRFEPIDAEENLKTLLRKMQRHSYSILPVFQSGQLVGVVDVKGLNQFLRSSS